MMSGMRALLAHATFSLLLAITATAQAADAPAVEWWQKDFDEGLATAKDKPAGMVLLYCWQDKHDVCSAMFGGTMSDKEVTPLLAEFLCASAKDDEAGKKVQQRYSVDTVPTVLFLDPSGAVVDLMVGYVPTKDFIAELKRIRAGTDTILDLRKKAAAAPGDLPLQLRLVHKLRSAKDNAGAATVIDGMIAKDPKQASEAGAEAMLLKLTDEMFKPGVQATAYDTKPLRLFLGRQKNKRVLFVGFDRLAAAEYRKGDLKAAAEAAGRAWKNIPTDQVRDWGQNIAHLAYTHWKELEKIDKDLLRQALDISERALKEVENAQKAAPDKPFHAIALWRHAAVQVVNNLRKEAFATMDKAIALDPNNENLKAARDRWLDGSK